MIRFKTILRLAFYLSVAMILFLEYVNLMQFKSTQKLDTVPSVPYTTAIPDTLEKMQEKRKISISKELKEYFDLKVQNGTHSAAQHEQTTWKEKWMKRFVFLEYLFANNNIVIPMLYVLMLAAFIGQIALLAMSQTFLQENIPVAEKTELLFFHLSEWSTLSPPILGVVGTLYSLGMTFMDLGDMSSLSTVFRDNFPNAAQTTILGGSLYAIHLLIHTFISTNLFVQKSRSVAQ